jgi:hypothetical protein
MTSKMQWSVVTFVVCRIVSAAGDRVQAGQRATGSDAFVEVTKVERGCVIRTSERRGGRRVRFG